MVAHALLIGPHYDDLRGIDEDIRLMTELLSARGFAVTRCVGLAATRVGILAAYEDLIASTLAGDAVVVYYSGHGNIVDAADTGQLDLQYVVPTDCGESTAEDFRGIASIELSILQARLTERTANVTVILDCCHAGFMSRGSGMHVKATRSLPYGWLKSHIDRLIAAGLPVQKWRTEGDPLAVRITACTTRQVSYEYDNDRGVRVGLLTESLTLAVREAGEHPVTWADVMDRVRQRVISLSYDQRPDVEGPSNRLLFSETTADLLTSLPVRLTGDGRTLRLECAPLLAVERDDEFVVMPAGAAGIDERASIGRLVVTEVGPLWADGQLTLSRDRRPDPSALIGARAFRSVMAAPRLAVKVSTEDPRAAAVIAELKDAPMARLATPADHEWLAEVRISPDGGQTVCDRIGPLHPARPAGTTGAAQIMEDLAILARTTQLRRLAGSLSLHADARVEWGKVVDGQRQPLDSGATLVSGDRIYVQSFNCGTMNRDVYVAIIDIGLTGRISVVTGKVGGWPVRRGGHYTLGQNQTTGELIGVELSWPSGLRPSDARPETLLVFVMSEAQDLRAVEQPGISQRRTRGGNSPLLGLLEQVRTGRKREVEPERDEPFGYDVHEIRFDLGPASS